MLARLLGLRGAFSARRALHAGLIGSAASLAAVAALGLGASPSPRVADAPAMRLATSGLPGYWLVASDGGIFPFGTARGLGSTGGMHLNKPIVGMASTADGGGYWLVASDGGIFPFGNAGGFGSTGGTSLNKPIVGMAATPSAKGYWLVASDGGIFPFGDAGGFGSTGGTPLNRPIVSMATTPSGHGYWLVASDGGIFPFGDAGGYGSTGGTPLNSPIVGMSSTPSGHGYWLVASDGGIFPFGDAAGFGSTGGMHLNQPIAGMSVAPGGQGYWLVASDGGIFPFGRAPGLGSTGAIHLNKPIVGMAASPVAVPVRVFLFTSQASLPADGVSTAALTVGVLGTPQAPVSDDPIAFAASPAGCGFISANAARTDVNGVMTATYRAGTTIEGCTVTATETLAGNSRTVSINQTIGAPGLIAASPAAPTTLTADQGSTGSAAVFTVTDLGGHPVSGVPVDFSTSMSHGAVMPGSATSNAQGTVTTTLTDTVAGDSGQVIATMHNSNVQGRTAAYTIVAGALHSLAISAVPATVTAGTPYTGTVTAADAFANPVNSAALTVSGTALDPQNGNTGTGSVGSFSNGQATVTVTSFKARPGATLMVSSASPAVNSNQVTTTVNPGAPSAMAVSSTATGYDVPSSTFTATSSGQQASFSLSLTDVYANAITAGPGSTDSVTVTLTPGSSADGGTITQGGGTSGPDNNGSVMQLVALSSGAGTFSYTAASPLPGVGTGTIATQDTTSNLAGTPVVRIVASRVSAVAVTPSTATPNQAAGQPLGVTATVTDSGNSPISGVAVDFTTTGTLVAGFSPASPVTTDSNGKASITETDTVAGHSGTVVATVHSTTVHGVTGQVTIIASTPGAIAIVTPASPVSLDADTGAGSGTPVTALVTDGHNNPVANASVTFGLGSSSTFSSCPCLSPATAVSTGPDGKATVTFKDSHAGDTGTVTATVTVTGGGTATQASPAITVGPGQPATIAVTQPTGPTNVSAGTAGTTGFPVDFVVKDAEHNVVSGTTVSFTHTGFPNGSVTPQASTDAHGQAVAVLTDGHSGDAGTITGTATAGTVNPSAQSPAITLVGATTSVVTSTAPASDASYTADTGSTGITLSFTVTDTHGVALSGVQLNLSVSSGLGHSTLPANTPATDGAGHTTVTLKDTFAGDSGKVTALDPAGAGTADTKLITITAGAISTVTTTLSTATTISADIGASGYPVPFTVFDAFNNPISGVQVDYTFGTPMSHGSLVPSNSNTDASGIAIATLIDTTAADAGTVTGTVHTGGQNTTSATLTIVPGDLASLTTTTPGTQVAGTAYTATVTAKDAHNNVEKQWANPVTVSGTALDAPRTGGTASGAVGPFGTNGTATVTITSLRSGSVGFTLSSTNLAHQTVTGSSSSYTVNPAAPVLIFFSASTPGWSQSTATFVANPPSLTQVTFAVTLTDSFGNPSAGTHGSDTVVVTLTPGATSDDGTLTPGGGSASQADLTGAVSVNVTLSLGTGTVTYTSSSVPHGGQGKGTISSSDGSFTQSPHPIRVVD